MNNKILIVTSEFPPQPGGIGNHAYQLAKQLDYKGYQVTVLTDERSGDKSEADFDKALPFQVIRIRLRNMRFFMYVERIIKALQCIKQTDIIIASGKFSIWNVACCNLFFQRKSMVVVHGSEVNSNSRIKHKAISLALKNFDTIIAVSHYTKQLVSHLNKSIHVIPNGIEFQYWNTPACETRTLNGNPVLTTVGRVSQRKGQLEVIKLLPELIQVFPELHYHCIGIPTEAELFLKEAERLGVTQYISFHGVVNEAELKQILMATDIFVMMSKAAPTGDVEGFGIAILEANALGIPALGSTGCGITDAINDGYSGFLIDLNDSKAFKIAMSRLLQDTTGFSKQAKQWARTHDWSEVIKQYEALI